MKKAVITGGCHGLGRAITEQFYQNGYLTYAIYHTSSQEAASLAATHPGLTVLACDVSDSSSVARLFDTLGAVDVLVNNAGVGARMLCTDMTDSDFDKLMKVNVYGTFYMCRAALSFMIRQGHGSIVNLSSIWGMTGGAMESAYSASKAAIIGLTKALAKECGPSGIRVNCVAPGFIDTDMNRDLTKEDKSLFFEQTPLGRGASAQEIADTVFYLAGEKASFITGQVISPNGGIVI